MEKILNADDPTSEAASRVVDLISDCTANEPLIALAGHAAVGLLPENSPYVGFVSMLVEASDAIFEAVSSRATNLEELEAIVAELHPGYDSISDEWETSNLFELEVANTLHWCVSDMRHERSASRSWMEVFYGYEAASFRLGDPPYRSTWKRMRIALLDLVEQITLFDEIGPAEMAICRSWVDGFSRRFKGDVAVAAARMGYTD